MRNNFLDRLSLSLYAFFSPRQFSCFTIFRGQTSAMANFNEGKLSLTFSHRQDLASINRGSEKLFSRAIELSARYKGC